MARLDPFTIARWQLTIWYVLISYAMLGFFTWAAMAAEHQAFLAVQHTVQSQVRGIVFNTVLQGQIEDFEHNFTQRLLIFDLLIGLVALLASYVLSGRTLRPVEKTVMQQKAFSEELSHELRTPLANIAMEIEARRHESKISQRDQQLLNSIQAEVGRMRGLVAGLLRLMRTNASAQAAHPVDYRTIIEEVVVGMRSQAAQRRQTIGIRVIGNPQVLAQADEIRQLTIILLDNAILYAYPDSHITVSLAILAKQVELKVHNRGPVIPEEELGLVFGRFYRGQGNTIPGNGLGLAIAQAIVERYKGRIAVASSQVDGTAFRVILPLYQG